MKTIIITSIMLMFLYNSNYATGIDKYEQTKQMFVKTEIIAINYRKKISKKTDFLDEIIVGENFMKLLPNNSPELFKNTNKYKWELLKMTNDSTLKRDFYTNYDITYTLYNLSIDDYLDVIDSSFVMVKNKMLSSNVFSTIIIQNCHLTILLAKNYKYPLLRTKLLRIREEIQSFKRDSEFKQSIVQEIDDILSGHSWYYVPDRIKQR